MSELIALFLSFMKIGAFSFGGGYAMIPLIREQVMGHGWLTMQEVSDLIAISQMTPGPIAVNAATFAGTKVAGLWGATFATVGVVLPSICITLLVSKYFFGFHNSKGVTAALYGLRPAVIGLILAGAFSVAGTAFFGAEIATGFQALFAALSHIEWKAVLIAVISFVAIRKFEVSATLMVFLSALLGVLFYIVF